MNLPIIAFAVYIFATHSFVDSQLNNATGFALLDVFIQYPAVSKTVLTLAGRFLYAYITEAYGLEFTGDKANMLAGFGVGAPFIEAAMSKYRAKTEGTSGAKNETAVKQD